MWLIQLEAGDGLCDEEVVHEIVRDGPECIQELVDLGVDFTRLDDGRQSLGKEEAHQTPYPPCERYDR